MLGLPKVKDIRGFSDFGYSYVYIIFEDGTDLYWARSRALEYLSGVQSHLPEGVKAELGPDATALGWVYQYALVDTSGKHSLSDLRSYQDWYLSYHLRSVPGVAEVAVVWAKGDDGEIGGYLDSGDLAYTDEAGRIFIAGRSKDLIIRSGHNILIISDRRMDREHVAIPAALALSAIHQHLVNRHPVPSGQGEQVGRGLRNHDAQHTNARRRFRSAG